MCFTAIAALGAAAVGARSANKATKAQTSAANSQMALDRDIFNMQTAAFQPYEQSGRNAMNALNFEMGLGDAPAGYGGFQQSPGYQFQMDQGQQAIDNSAAARGQQFSGATLRAQQQFGQGLANQDYGNYMNRLSGMAASGQAAAGNQANAAGNMGISSGNALAARGNAQAAGAIGMGNAVTGGINNIIGLAGYQNATNGGNNSLFGANSWGAR